MLMKTHLKVKGLGGNSNSNNSNNYNSYYHRFHFLLQILIVRRTCCRAAMVSFFHLTASSCSARPLRGAAAAASVPVLPAPAACSATPSNVTRDPSHFAPPSTPGT